MTLEKGGEARGFAKKNDSIRIEILGELEMGERVALRAFFRRLDALHFYEERVLPWMKKGEATIAAAMSDRPWPPWGLGAQRVHALLMAHPVGEDSFALSPVFTDVEDTTNIGLVAAVFQELLAELSRDRSVEVNYAVIDGSFYADRILKKHGFEPSEDILLTEDARYNVYRADAAKLVRSLGLTEVSVQELLAHDFDDAVLERNGLFHSTIRLSILDSILERIRRPEMIIVDLGRFDASLPGGVPPSPPAP